MTISDTSNHIDEDQFQSDPFDMIEVRFSRLENMHRNEKILHTQSLTIPNTSSHIDENQQSWYVEDFNEDSISPQNLELDQYQPIDKLTSFHFNKIELEYECDPDLQICNSIPAFESMFTLVSLTKFDYFLSQY